VKKMSEEVKAEAVLTGKIEKIREGVLDYRIVRGKIDFVRPLTKCEKLLKEWGSCVKEGVKIMCDIRPMIGPMWNYGTERALFIVTVVNKTGYFRLDEVTVHLLSVKSKQGKATPYKEPCSPEVIELHPIRPGGSANTQNPKRSWCGNSPHTPPKPGFTLIGGRVFPGMDVVEGRALVTYKATPYFEDYCQAQESIVGT
jgi:hypothetical protein